MLEADGLESWESANRGLRGDNCHPFHPARTVNLFTSGRSTGGDNFIESAAGSLVCLDAIVTLPLVRGHYSAVCPFLRAEVHCQ